MPEPLRCNVSPHDRIDVLPAETSGLIGVQVAFDGEDFSPSRTIFLTAEDARRLRKRLKRSLEDSE